MEITIIKHKKLGYRGTVNINNGIIHIAGFTPELVKEKAIEMGLPIV